MRRKRRELGVANRGLRVRGRSEFKEDLGVRAGGTAGKEKGKRRREVDGGEVKGEKME